jgi:phenylacetate-coenzyme A ligase PaaK-like adenylate-forming protein
MIDFDAIYILSPYSLNKEEKAKFFGEMISFLTEVHYHGCWQYKRILDAIGFKSAKVKDLQDFPFLPVRIFKTYDMLSVQKRNIIKTMTSSGTTGQKLSRIYLSRENATSQMKVLSRITSSFLGKKRLPMLVIDSRAVLKDRHQFSARGAGILGFSIIGYDVTYALDEQMNLDMEVLTHFLEKHSGKTKLIFGFTFMIWEYFLKPLKQLQKICIENGIMIHGGGWKKLSEQAVNNEEFKEIVGDVSGIKRVHNYYGMVEQTGSIFMECQYGHLHASIFSDIIIRDHRDFMNLPLGKQGLVQLLSLLPVSYPGHSILTEDLGRILGEDDCPCGRSGKYLEINGRIENAEIRGCSDTYASGKK